MKTTNYTVLAEELLLELAKHSPPEDMTGKIARVRRYFIKVKSLEETGVRMRTIKGPQLPKALERLAKSFPGVAVGKTHRVGHLTYFVHPRVGWRWAKLSPSPTKVGKIQPLPHAQASFYSTDSVMVDMLVRDYGVERIPEPAQEGITQ